MTRLFALPRQYLLRNSLEPFPTISYSHFPQIAEMLYLAGISLSDYLPAQMVNLWFWLALILLGRELFGLWFNSPHRIISTILLTTLPILCVLTHLTTNDVPLAFFILAGVYLLSNDQIPVIRRALLFGIIAGLGCSLKLTAYLYLLLPQSIWLSYLWLKTDPKKFLRAGLISGLTFVLICFPFWMRNLGTTGNPFFPALTQLFGGPLSAEQTRAIWEDAKGVRYDKNLFKELFHLPHEFFYSPFSKIRKSRAVPFFGTPLLAGLILLLLKKPTGKQVQVFLYCLGFYLLWAFSFRLSRFALGLWTLLAILSAGGFSLALNKSTWQKKIVVFLLILTLIIGFILELFFGVRETGWEMLLHKKSASQYLYRRSRVYLIQLGAYPALDWLNHNSRAEDQVLLLGPTCFFYLERKAYASSFIDWNPLMVYSI